jgi:hypothetical protein
MLYPLEHPLKSPLLASFSVTRPGKAFGYGKNTMDLGRKYGDIVRGLLHMQHMPFISCDKSQCFQSVKCPYNKLAMGEPARHLIN